jgi:hypothetical protein
MHVLRLRMDQHGILFAAYLVFERFDELRPARLRFGSDWKQDERPCRSIRRSGEVAGQDDDGADDVIGAFEENAFDLVNIGLKGGREFDGRRKFLGGGGDGTHYFEFHSSRNEDQYSRDLSIVPGLDMQLARRRPGRCEFGITFYLTVLDHDWIVAKAAVGPFAVECFVHSGCGDGFHGVSISAFLGRSYR